MGGPLSERKGLILRAIHLVVAACGTDGLPVLQVTVPLRDPVLGAWRVVFPLRPFPALKIWEKGIGRK